MKMKIVTVYLMKVVKKIHPERRTEDSHSIPTKEGPNDYQYYRSYDNGWHISVVCNYAIRNYEEGCFEIGVFTYDSNSKFWNKGTIIIGTALDFEEVATFLKEFTDNPERAVSKRYIEVENGI